MIRKTKLHTICCSFLVFSATGLASLFAAESALTDLSFSSKATINDQVFSDLGQDFLFSNDLANDFLAKNSEQGYLLSDLDGLNSPVFNLSPQDSNGQWSVSFDLQDTSNGFAENNITDLQVGAEFSSGDSKSQFFVNYGDRKVPIYISFDEDFLSQQSVERQDLALGYQQTLNESWAVSINYLESNLNVNADNQQLPLVSQLNSGLEYLFPVGTSSQLGTINLDPSYNSFAQVGRNISGIEIKVTRKMSDGLSLAASYSQAQGQSKLFATQDSARLADSISTNYSNNSFEQDVLTLNGQYRLANNWALAAQIDHKRQSVDYSESGALTNFTSLKSTTLDIGLKYQTQWEQVGLVISVDLQNLLGVNRLSGDNQQGFGLGLDERGLLPYTFQSPKYIKLSGSINF